MNGRMRWMIPVLCAGALAFTTLPEERGDAVGPTIVMVNPSADGQQVRTLRNSELSPILGSLNSANGINRVTVFVKRVSDSNYWNGLGWVTTSTGLSATVSAGSPSPPYFDFRVDAGPNASAITAGAEYQIRVDAWDQTGSLSTRILTVVGID